MAFYDKFPYTNFQEINLDKLIIKILQLELEQKEFINNNVIKYADPIQWNITTQYEANTVVTDQAGNAYISSQPVPVGVSINNTDYWSKVGNFDELWSDIKNAISPADEGSGSTATAARSVNDLVWMNNNLYIVTAPMIAGDSYVVGSNCEPTSIDEELKKLIAGLDQEITDREQAVAQEITNREQAVAQETLAREQAIAQEAHAREEAIEELREEFVAQVRDTTYVNVKDFNVVSDTGTDQYYTIQDVIDTHPGATIYFPDGVYNVSQPIKVYGATDRTVFIKLSERATLKALDSNTDYVVEIGTDGSRDNTSVWVNGGMTGISGGRIDCAGKSGGIHIVTGIQAPDISDITIINVRKTGIKIETGINNGSCDALIESVKIFGMYTYIQETENSIGIDCEAADNTFSDIQIMGVWKGVRLTRGGNVCRNIHPVFANSDMSNHYPTTAFDVLGTNFFYECYADSFSIGLRFRDNSPSIVNGLYCYWYNNAAFAHQFAFYFDQECHISASNVQIGFTTIPGAQYSGVVFGSGAGRKCKGIFRNVVINDESKLTAYEPMLWMIIGHQFAQETLNGVTVTAFRESETSVRFAVDGTPTTTGMQLLTSFRDYLPKPSRNRGTGFFGSPTSSSSINGIRWFPNDTEFPQLCINSTSQYLTGCGSLTIS